MEKIFEEKVRLGFITCRKSDCGMREHCLRWLGRNYVSRTLKVVTTVNLNNPEIGGDRCPMLRKNEPVRFAFGFTKLLEEMPRKKGKALMDKMIDMSNRTYAYEYRNGTRPIPPSMQQKIITSCRQLEWQQPVEFDRYAEDIEW